MFAKSKQTLLTQADLKMLLVAQAVFSFTSPEQGLTEPNNCASVIRCATSEEERILTEKLVLTIRQSDTHEFKSLLHKLMDTNILDESGYTPLYYTARLNRIEMAEALIKRGANVKGLCGPTLDETSPLHVACQQGHLSMVRLLVASGADPLQQDAEGLTALHMAAKFGRNLILTYFLALGYSPDVTDSTGVTPLMSACDGKSAPTLLALVKYGAYLNRRDFAEGDTALHCALKKGNLIAAKVLIEQGADLDVENGVRETPLDILMRSCLCSKANIEERNEVLLVAGKKMPELALYSEHREWPVALVPAIVFAWTTRVLQAGVNYWTKAMWIFMLLCALHFVLRNVGPIRLGRIFPLSFLTTLKVAICSSWYHWYFLVVSPTMSAVTVAAALCSAILFMGCFRNPGFCYTTDMVRDKNVIELCESNVMNDRTWCSTCVLRRPLRSKHCHYCGKCVARFDHHCPFLHNCIGWRNHGIFIAFLAADVVAYALYLYGAHIFFRKKSTEAGFDLYGYSRPRPQKAEWGAEIILDDLKKTFSPDDWDYEYWRNVGALMQENTVQVYATLGAILVAAFTLGLLIMQLYQVIWLGMTTNERLNWKRYREEYYAELTEDRFPFRHGMCGNLVEFFSTSPSDGSSSSGTTDWNYKYRV